MQNIKRGFIQALWGFFDRSQRHFKHRGKIDNDIRLASLNKYNPNYTTFVFGEDNHKQLIDNGFKDTILVDKRPFVWDMNTQQFRHKLEILKLGMQQYDEIVYTDLDTMPVKQIPDNFWDVLNKKEPMQAILRMYHRRKCYWRKIDQRKVPCAAFIYIRDKSIPQGIIDVWENGKGSFYEEIAMMQYMDKMMDGWKGNDYYWNHFEPDFFNLLCNTAYENKELLKTKNICFEHFRHTLVANLLKNIDNNKKINYECFIK